MTTWMVALLVILLPSKSLGFGGSPSKPKPKPSPLPSITVTPSPLPSEDHTPPPEGISNHIRFSPVKNYTKSEKEVLVIAEDLANQVVSSQCFENFMVNRNLIQTNGLTRQGVVDFLRAKDLSVPVTMYYKNNNVVGYRQPPYPTVHTNRKFHAGATACRRASNLTHEWAHVAGFKHAYKASKSRPRSVPYSINEAMEVCCSCKGIRDCKVKE